MNIVSQYRESVLGTFWVSGSIAIFVVLLGNLYALIFGYESSEFIPYLAIGYIFWHLISRSISIGLTVYKSNRNFILQSRMPLPVYNMKSILELLVVFAHNSLVIIAVLLWYWIFPSFADILLFFIAVIFIFLNIIWVSITLGFLGAAYKDIIEITNILLRISFLATPILWKVNGNKSREAIEGVMLFNPFYHFIEIVRAPLLGTEIPSASWPIVIVITILGFLFAAVIYRHLLRKIAIWI